MNRRALVEQIKAHEGYRKAPYLDTRGYWTVGWGHLIHFTKSTVEQNLGELLNALSDRAQHDRWLAEDLKIAEEGARKWLDFDKLTDTRKRIAVEMCFVLGVRGARGFVDFTAAVEAEDHHTAALKLVDSLWYREHATRRVAGLAEQWAEG